MSIIRIADVHIDDEIHPRHVVNSALVAEYSEAMQKGADFPPITVFLDNKSYFLADGRHRIEASKLIGRNSIDAEILRGTKRDAILFAVGANATHGIRRTNADKRKAVNILLADKEWRKWSLNRIAQQCNVSDGLVKTVWKDLEDELHLPKLEDTDERKVVRSGKIYAQKKGQRGRKSEESASVGRTIYSVISRVSEARDQLQESKPELVEQVDRITTELEELLGGATGADFRLTKGLNAPINVYERPRKGGILKTPEFQKKKLCNYSVGVGMSCGHQCTYCSTPSLLRTHEVYKDIQQTSFQKGYAIVDPGTAERVARDIPNLTADDIIELSTIDDAWSPEARKFNLGRKTMEVLLKKTPAQVRVLTKSAEVANDFDLFAKYKKRIILGLSTGIPKSRGKLADVLEPNASPIKDRLRALKDAHKRGLRTYGMLCPCLPLIASSIDALDEMFDDVLACAPEDIWLEPVNARGNALNHTERQLRRAGYVDEANAIGMIRKEDGWSLYTVGLIKNALVTAREKKVLDRLHILLYPKNLTTEHRSDLKKFKQGIIWLGNEESESAD